MTQYNTLNVKLFNLQLNKLKSGVKNGTEVTLKLSSNVAGVSNDRNNFQHKFVLTNTQVSKLRKTVANNSSANINLSKTRLHKIGQSGGFLGRPLGRLLKNRLPWMKNVLKPLAKSVLVLLGLTEAAATDTAIHKKIFVSGTTLMVSNEGMNDIINKIKLLNESRLFIKDVS